MNALSLLDDVRQSLANVAELRRRGAEHSAESKRAVNDGARMLNGLSVPNVADVLSALDAVEQSFAQQVAALEAPPVVCDGCGNARRAAALVDGLCSRCI